VGHAAARQQEPQPDPAQEEVVEVDDALRPGRPAKRRPRVRGTGDRHELVAIGGCRHERHGVAAVPTDEAAPERRRQEGEGVADAIRAGRTTGSALAPRSGGDAGTIRQRVERRGLRGEPGAVERAAGEAWLQRSEVSRRCRRTWSACALTVTRPAPPSS